MPAALRTVLFWVLMLVLAIVLWKMSSNSKSAASEAPSTMSYSDFMAQVDKANIMSVKLLESPATAEIDGQLREPQEKFRTTIPKETIPALTDQLRKQGVSIEVTEVKDVRWLTLVINLSPFIVILAIWIYMMRNRMIRRSGQNTPPASTTPAIPTNRPIG